MVTPSRLPTIPGARYVLPLREGGSLPGVVDTDGQGTFVVKFRGAGQGPKALIAEALVASIGLAVGLPVPTPAVVDLADGFGRSEPDPEIQDLLQASIGANFGLEYVHGALAFDPAIDGALLTPELAADIVWLDAYVTNVDRTPRNTNLLVCGRQVWLIDHGAALFIHHRWSGWRARVQSPFPQIGDHVLLPFAADLEAADARPRPMLDPAPLADIVQDVPEARLSPDDQFADTQAQREVYTTYLIERLNGSRAWVAEAVTAQKRGPKPLGPRQTHRWEPKGS